MTVHALPSAVAFSVRLDIHDAYIRDHGDDLDAAARAAHVAPQLARFILYRLVVGTAADGCVRPTLAYLAEQTGQRRVPEAKRTHPGERRTGQVSRALKALRAVGLIEVAARPVSPGRNGGTGKATTYRVMYARMGPRDGDTSTDLDAVACAGMGPRAGDPSTSPGTGMGPRDLDAPGRLDAVACAGMGPRAEAVGVGTGPNTRPAGMGTHPRGPNTGAVDNVPDAGNGSAFPRESVRANDATPLGLYFGNTPGPSDIRPASTPPDPQGNTRTLDPWVVRLVDLAVGRNRTFTPRDPAAYRKRLATIARDLRDKYGPLDLDQYGAPLSDVVLAYAKGETADAARKILADALDNSRRGPTAPTPADPPSPEYLAMRAARRERVPA